MKNERGYALIFVLLTIVLIGVIGFSLLTVSSNTMNTSANERVSQSSFYIAEAGVNIKSARIQQLIQKKYIELQNNPVQFNTNYKDAITLILAAEQHSTYDENHFNSTVNGIPKAEVYVDYDPNNPFEFKIISTGHLSGQHKRELEKSFSIISNPYTSDEKEPTEENTDSPELIKPTQPVAPANIYVNNYLSLVSVQNVKFNALVKHKKNREATTSAVTSFSQDNRQALLEKISYGQNFSVPTPVEPNLLQDFSIDSSISNVNTALFNTKDNNIPNTIQLTADKQTLTTDMKVPEIKNNTSHTLNLHVNDTRNLYFFERSSKYNFSNLTFNVTGNGTLNLIFLDNLIVSAGRQFIIQAPNTKVNLLLEKGADIRGKANVQNIYSHSGEIDVHDRGELKTLDIYSNKGDIDIENYSKLYARNIFVKEKELKIFSDGSVTAQNIYLGNGHLDMNNNSKLSAKNIMLNDGDIKLSYSTNLQANSIFVKNGDVSAVINSKLTSKTITTMNGEVNNYTGAIIVADTIYSAEDVRIDARMNVNTIYANRIWGTLSTRINANEDLDEGHFKPGETDKNKEPSSSFLDPSQLISSKPVVEVQ